MSGKLVAMSDRNRSARDRQAVANAQRARLTRPIDPDDDGPDDDPEFDDAA